MELPEWDLSDLYPSIDSEELARDLERVTWDAKEFAAEFKERVSDLDGDALAAAIARYEACQELMGRIGSFAGLTYAGNVEDPEIGAFFQDTQEQLNLVGTDLLFFSLELNLIDEDALAHLLECSTALQHYRPWIRDIRVFRPYQLSDELERLLHEKDVAGRAAWVRLFDQTMVGLRFDVEGRSLSSEEALHLLSDPDGAVRKQAANELSRVFEQNVRTFSLITNTLAKDKEVEDKWRGYPDASTARHLSNQVEPEVVEALVASVQHSYPRLSHRYYALKAQWLGKEHLEHWDRNAPLPDSAERNIGWTDARDIVLDAYATFSQEMSDIARRFFENGWIDAQVRAGKSPGAFSHPTVPSVHPYVLLNYQGKTRDVMTLAHELGHGVHQMLAGAQGTLMASTPLTLAETASVFGEQLTFRALLAEEQDAARRRGMLAGKVEDMLNTVVRQIAFYEFETRVHRERALGELTSERLGEIWLDVQTESLGPAFQLGSDYRSYWCYIPHFLHSPFYVYAYAFGDCLVNSLYAVYLDAHEGFQERYFEMLKAGGTLRHKELLAPFGLDASDPGFWDKGLSVISAFVDQLEAA
tara:strand:+ start:761 stop:2518 length:1758 start_codon:yes stop_codon:yes gene_type:complete